MAHYVKCVYCGANFDRDKEPYVSPNPRRYGHKDCYLRDKVNRTDKPNLEIIDPTNFVTCKYCRKVFDKSKEPFKLFTNGKYAHESCY